MITNGNIKKGRSLKDTIDISKYRTFGAETVEEYTQKIKSLNIIDLCAQAVQYGLAPSLERRRLEKSLVTEFIKAKASYNAACGNTPEVPEVPEDKKERLKRTLDFIRSA